jgi:hypothetical protein
VPSAPHGREQYERRCCVSTQWGALPPERSLHAPGGLLCVEGRGVGALAGCARCSVGERHSARPGATRREGTTARRAILRRGSCVLVRVGAISRPRSRTLALRKPAGSRSARTVPLRPPERFAAPRQDARRSGLARLPDPVGLSAQAHPVEVKRVARDRRAAGVARISAAGRSWCPRPLSGRSRRAAASTSSASTAFDGVDACGADAGCGSPFERTHPANASRSTGDQSLAQIGVLALASLDAGCGRYLLVICSRTLRTSAVNSPTL